MSSLHFFAGYNQVITYWQYNAVNGFGERSFLAPVLLKGRWSGVSQLIITNSGEQVPSRSVIYLQQDVQVGEYLAQGDFTGIADPTSIPKSAFMILKFNQDMSVLGDDLFRQAFL